ncbi:unnamed protein product [Hydatigera taeniaeformis]|uniref:HD/PDEase domain-containing protein n=1 Tax=Hydatigena taeniaeformis TaxID=6205 RepID=A0A3P7FTW2_HYDTA|nr:unnamed protein product [Hydatigera taeniaeformis]
MRFIDTPEFQRLRRLHQLGLAKYVYPDCTHTRFEHSLGTYHLARRLVEAIQSDPQCASVRLTNSERMCVMIAALCHDIGMGFAIFFVHCFFLFFSHENMSCLIVKRIVAKDHPLRDFLKASGVDLELVSALICGHPTPELVVRLIYFLNADADTPPKFLCSSGCLLLQIVSNTLNGNDVDKWDYIMRDSLHAGMGQGQGVIEVERMLRFYRPAYYASDDAWHMSFRSSEYSNIMRIFSQRTRLFRSVYAHKTALTIEAMFIDILNALESTLHLRDLSLRACAGDDNAIEKYLQLDEHCLWVMASSQYPHPSEASSLIKADLLRSTHLCQRIEFRQLYSFVGKFLVMEKKNHMDEYNHQHAKNESDMDELLGNASEPKDVLDVIEVEVTTSSLTFQ